MALAFSQFFFWFVLFRQLKGKPPIVLLEPTFGFFKVGARIEFTVIMHATGMFLLCFVHPIFAGIIMLSLEVKDGFMSDQGMDFADLAFNFLGYAVWYEQSNVHLIGFLFT